MKSFKEFLKAKHYYTLCHAVTEYIEEKRNNLSIALRNVTHVDYIKVDDFDIKVVQIRNEAGLGISFDAIIEVELELYDYSQKKERIENASQWFSCNCIGSLRDNLTDIEVINVEEYTGKRFGDPSLTDQLVPVIHHEDLDRIASEFLKKYYPKALLEPLRIDVYKLAETMHLSIIERTITNNGAIFGQLFFRESEHPFYNENGEATVETVPSDTIVLDPAIFFLRDVGTVNHTIVHECVHKEYHYKKYLFESIYDREHVSTRCGTNGDAEYSSSNESYLEWQANALASHILMPEIPFKKLAFDLIKKSGAERGDFKLIDVLPAVIDQLAAFFGVSRIAAKIRLIDCGYERAIGVYEYLDGHYLRPYSFREGALKRRQTFSINRLDAAVLTLTSPALGALAEQGIYRYVESHFVLNHSKYIFQADGKLPLLTDYALSHMDECCLVFDLQISGQDNEWHAMYYLNRSDHSPIRFDIFYNDGFQNSQDNLKKNEILQKEISETSTLASNLPDNFQEALKKVREWRNVSQKEIASRSGLSEKTVSRAFSGENIDLNTVILLCIALQIPYVISEKLLKSSGHNLVMSNPIHQQYRFILTYYYAQNIDEINKYLNDNSISSL